MANYRWIRAKKAFILLIRVPASVRTGLILVLVIGSGKDGDRLVILLEGGTKKRQNADIAAAKGQWRDYKRRNRQGVA